MKLTNEQIVGFLIISEMFDVMYNELELNLAQLNLKPKKEREHNTKFRKLCMQIVSYEEIPDEERDFLFLTIAASQKMYLDTKNYEENLFNQLNESGFFEHLKNFDKEDFENRKNAIREKYDLDLTREIAKEIGIDLIDDEEIDELDEDFTNKAFEKKYGNVKKAYWADGKLQKETPLNDEGEIHGVGKTYHRNGNLEQEAPHVNGEINGTVKQYYEDGSIQTTAEHKNDMKHGLTKQYYSNGVLGFEAEFYENEMIEESVKRYDGDGNLTSSDGKDIVSDDGIQKLYHDNGVVSQEVPYNDDGEIHGVVKVYFENGIIRQEVPHNNGLVEGIVKEYDDEGRIEVETPYENGKVSGIQRGYYISGSKEYETAYENDEKTDGVQYYDSGEVKALIDYENGLRDGWLKQYYENGNLAKEALFDKDEVVFETIKEYGEDGSIQPTRIRLQE